MIDSTKFRVIVGSIVAGLLLLFLVASCSQRPQYGYAQGMTVAQPMVTPAAAAPAVVAAPAPVVVNGGGGSHMGDSLIGSMIGSTAGTMLGNHLSRPRTEAAPAPVAPVQAAGAAPRYVAPQVSTTAPAQRYSPPVRQTVTTTSSGATRVSIGRTPTTVIRRR